MSNAIKLDINDVRKHGSVSAAILAYCTDDSDYASGTVGPAFSTSGPGPGWSQTHGASDFARRALGEGAQGYIDASDGRMATLEEADEDDDEDDCITDGSGDVTLYRIVWSDGSEVELICPSAEEATDEPKALAAMLSELPTHAPQSDLKAWRKLVTSLRETVELIVDFDLDDLPE